VNPKAAKKPRLMRGGEGDDTDDFSIHAISPEADDKNGTMLL
jgi:hypothetical protein